MYTRLPCGGLVVPLGAMPEDGQRYLRLHRYLSTIGSAAVFEQTAEKILLRVSALRQFRLLRVMGKLGVPARDINFPRDVPPRVIGQ